MVITMLLQWPQSACIGVWSVAWLQEWGGEVGSEDCARGGWQLSSSHASPISVEHQDLEGRAEAGTGQPLSAEQSRKGYLCV